HAPFPVPGDFEALVKWPNALVQRFGKHEERPALHPAAVRGSIIRDRLIRAVMRTTLPAVTHADDRMRKVDQFTASLNRVQTIAQRLGKAHIIDIPEADDITLRGTHAPVPRGIDAFAHDFNHAHTGIFLLKFPQ